MSTLASGARSVDPARGGGEHTQLYHTPDGNGRASAPEGVDVAAGSAGSIPLAKSDAKLKKSNWFGGAMDTVVKVFQSTFHNTKEDSEKGQQNDHQIFSKGRRFITGARGGISRLTSTNSTSNR
ncbi:hypothetical protein AB1Y20_015800 [Prymnesium parvum]|uniref:Uncharacterized protein n=1 Tax=Prymnesium parvum TaxID=97485 RepID=A0AB34JY54_PRYPA